MNTNYHIRYLKRQEIDTNRWDQCINGAPNGLIYGFHYYLDHMAAGQWDALVLDDYAAVMPLTWRRKAGIRYLYQPAFTQQTGIFSYEELSPALIRAFLAASARHFRFAEIFLNYDNPLPHFQLHTNYILSLETPYSRLSANYKGQLVRSLKQAYGSSLDYRTDLDAATAIDNYRRQYAHKINSIRQKDYRQFQRLSADLQQHGQVLVRAVADIREQLLATALLLRDSKRLYLLLPATLPAGREAKASHFLIDQLIKEWAESPMILDFEGSDLPGVARFYANFGATVQPYFFYHFNRLPWPARLLKR
jgi:hypothetical protein